MKWYCELSPETAAAGNETMTKESALLGLGRETFPREAAHGLNQQIGQHAKAPPTGI
jgi:hypothetical protein